jgi:hypothetical protein
MTAMSTSQMDPEHYEECPASESTVAKCLCEAINREAEAYYSEPPDMFAREWGCY